MSDRYCTFFLCDRYFGVNVDLVQEVLRYQEMTPVPRANPEIQGLINLRGQIVTAVDLRLLLALPSRPDDEKPMNVVLSTNGETISLLVDEIGDVIEVDEADFELPPKNLRNETRRLIKGVYKQEKQLLLILDAESAIWHAQL